MGSGRGRCRCRCHRGNRCGGRSSRPVGCTMHVTGGWLAVMRHGSSRLGRMHVHRMRRKRCSWRACSGSSAWRPASLQAPVVGADNVAHPEKSGFTMRMRLRRWLWSAKVARVVDAIHFPPLRNGGGSLPAAAHSLGECQKALVRRRRQFSDLGLGFSNASCAWRKCTVGQRVAVGSTRDVATRTGAQLSADSAQHVRAVCRPWVQITQMRAHIARDRRGRFSTIEKR
jgi:hypothetical protein